MREKGNERSGMDTSDLFGGAELSSSSGEDEDEAFETRRPREDASKDAKKGEETTGDDVTTVAKKTKIDESAVKATETPSMGAKVEPTVC